MSHIDLYCIPYAGGSAMAAYGKWARAFDPTIKVNPLELAGHGKRLAEPFHQSVQSAVSDMLACIQENIAERPYALYGHSMGTVLAYELAVAVRDAGLPQPKVLFLSGRQPPHYVYKVNDVHLLPDQDFLQYIKRIGGTPQELFESEALLKVFKPILRNDYRMIEQYQFRGLNVPLETDIVFFFSDLDQLVNKNGILEWSRYTSRSFECHDFKGGHFFIHDVWQDICQIIYRKLARVMIC